MPTAPETEFDEWHQDIYDPNTGKLIQKDVLFIRATYKNVSFQCPVWFENPTTIEDVKELLRRQVERVSRTQA
jgi:hypothetical protein